MDDDGTYIGTESVISEINMDRATNYNEGIAMN